ncbi:unnamed protein product [Tenebrio molitor]|nr:unnamed protein product [Tenebrio molitor]
MKILELYSGIGGMHLALLASGVKGEIKKSIDISPIANSVYKHNFSERLLLYHNLDGLTKEMVEGFDVDTILMSPPCQPFTRNGNQQDIADFRTTSFVHLMEIFPTLQTIKRILVENVVGFEVSQMRELLVSTLTECGFICQEYILSPHQVGIPNSRRRYYLLGKKHPLEFPFEVGPLTYDFPLSEVSANLNNLISIGDILEENQDFSQYYISDKILRKYFNILDICYSHSRNSCCFTKSYSRYIEGAGSVFTEKSEEFVKTILSQIENVEKGSDEYLKLVVQLKLRFFTPREVCRLMCFPETFSFPPGMENRKKYMLLGNSVNVKVVSELIRLLVH